MASLRSMMGTPRPKFGCYVIEFDSPGIGQILAAAGCHYAIIDTEHSGFTHEQLKRLVKSFQAADLPAIVNTTTSDYDMIARALDVGADAIQPSQVDSVEEARAILDHMRYPPKGHRGVALGIAHDRYRPGTPAAKLRAANRDVVFFPKIETPAGVEAIEGIAALDGVAGIWIGHFDLSVRMDIAAQFDHPAFTAALARVASACRRNGLSLGRIVDDAATGGALYKTGFDFLCFSGDSWLLRRALSDGIGALRKACRGPRKAGVKAVR